MALSKEFKTNAIKEIIDYIIKNELQDYTYSLNIMNALLPKQNLDCGIANESFIIENVDVSHSDQHIHFEIKDVK